MNELLQRFNFFRAPNQSMSSRIRMIIGIVGTGVTIYALFFAGNIASTILLLLLLLFSLHYLLGGLAENIPANATQTAGVLRILSLVVSVVGMLTAITLLIQTII